MKNFKFRCTIEKKWPGWGVYLGGIRIQWFWNELHALQWANFINSSIKYNEEITRMEGAVEAYDRIKAKLKEHDITD